MLTPRSSLLPALAAALVGVQVGAAIVATRFVIAQTEPASLAMLRYLIGFLCLLPFVWRAGHVPFRRRDLLPISVLGVVQFGIVVALLNTALQFISSARSALLFATFPLQTMLFAAVLGHERLTLTKAAGVLLTIIGVSFALGTDAVEGGEGFLGELAALGSASAGAVCSVLYRPYLRRYPALQVGAFAMLTSVIFLAFLAASEGFFSAFPEFTFSGWLAVLFIGASSGLGYYLLLWALNRMTPTKVTVFLGLSPVIAVGLGVLLLGEKVTPFLFTSVACVVLGIGLAYLPR